MTNTEIIQAIRNEIDKRYAEYREKMKSDDFTYYEGMADALDLFEQFIDTLESEKPMQEGFEEEISRYIDDERNKPTHEYGWNVDDIQKCARHFAKWGAEHTPLPEDTVLFNKGVAEGKRLMMEEEAMAEMYDNKMGG